MAIELPPEFRERISKEEINDLPMCKWEGEIHLVQSAKRLKSALAALRQESAPIILGFDTESRPCFKKGEHYPPSLVQLAGAQDVYIIQLASVGKLDPLAELLADPSVIKAGVGLEQDNRQLQELMPFEPGGFVDVGEAATRAGGENGSLRGMAARFLDIRISKTAQCSNWSRPKLEPAQIYYAATDAWVSREIYLYLQRHGLV
ncbi:MAG: 3'-5' exonuclease domain-containing protein 2 [Magnetococcales bacterium]|nr:3'-5' exonuclease domain-containing protein 2 [Magnetococcales bacterium]